MKLAYTRTRFLVKLTLLMKQVLHLFQSDLLMLPYRTNSDVGWGLMVFQYFVILRHSFPAFVVWTDFIGFLIISFAVSRRTRGEKEATPQLPFLMQRLWCSHTTSGAICTKSLVKFFSPQQGSISISLCTPCNHCFLQRTSAGTATSKASYPPAVLSFESTPYDVDTIF